jgi:membrane protein
MWLRKPYLLIREVINVWLAANAPTMGAAIAYYTLFSIAPLLMIILGVAGLIFGATAARGELADQINSFVGRGTAEAIQTVLTNTQQGHSSTLAIVVGAIVLLIGASGAFSEIQSALNIIWSVLPKEGRGFRAIVRDRVLSFAMVLASCLVLLASLVAGAIVANLGNYWSRAGFPDDSLALQAANTGISLLVLITLITLIYKYLPDAIIAWRDAAVGALVTAILFTLGRHLLSFYLSRTTVASAFGAAGSLALVLVWLYYSAQLFLFGAAFTRVWAERCGRSVRSRVLAQGDPNTVKRTT